LIKGTLSFHEHIEPVTVRMQHAGSHALYSIPAWADPETHWEYIEDEIAEFKYRVQMKFTQGGQAS